MSVRIQIVIAFFTILALAVIVNMIRKKRLELRYALIWLIIGIGVLILDCFPNLISHLAKILGIGLPMNMLFFVGFCFTLMILFVLTVAVSRMSIRIKSLTQEMALYEHEKNQDQKESEDNEDQTGIQA